MPRMRREMSDIVERQRVEPEPARLIGEAREIGGDPVPLLAALRAVHGEPFERDFRPIDAPLADAAEKRTDRVEQAPLHAGQGVDGGRMPWWSR